jgi:hypothetical protein
MKSGRRRCTAGCDVRRRHDVCLRAGKRLWTRAEEAVLRARYPHERTATIARSLRRPLSSTYQHAARLGLSKTAAYLASADACRLRRGDNPGVPFRFKKGHVPANKGLRRPGWGPGRMKETWFKRGVRQCVAVRLYKPIGTERMSKDGYLERKTNDNLPLQARWRAVHLLVWEEEHGPVPKGHAIVFRNGDKRDIRLDNLECITRRELMARNAVHNLPKPLAQAIQLLGALNRKIRRRRSVHAEESNRGPAQPPVRRPRGPGRHGEADGARAGASHR